MRRRKTFIIGLTGSIGMGKSTTAKMFLKEGIPVWDADAAVHRMYSKGGLAISPIQMLCPSAIIDGAIDRSILKSWISSDATALKKIEAVVHPLLAKDRSNFLAELEADIALLDFPLLLETGAEASVDLIVVVTAPSDTQRQRILARNTMNSALLDTILAAQMPDSEKRAKADVVIETFSLEATREAVQKLLKEIRKGEFDA